MADNLSFFNVIIYYKYLEKKESGIHISVCLEVLNLGHQSYKFRKIVKLEGSLLYQNSLICPTKLISNGFGKFEII